MSIDPDRFKRSIIEVLAKRASSLCSNPDCRAITSGPAQDEDCSITVGEAAHIYGARPGAARYDAQMTAAERSVITNAIWLCRNCHRIIDADPNQFPATLLFEWRQEHERDVAERLGKAGDRLRRKVMDRELEGFEGASYLSRQIVIDKPYAWEYRLTAELLRSKLAPVLSRSRALARGLYARPVTRLSADHPTEWFQDRLADRPTGLSVGGDRQHRVSRGLGSAWTTRLTRSDPASVQPFRGRMSTVASMRREHSLHGYAGRLQGVWWLTCRHSNSRSRSGKRDTSGAGEDFCRR